ncbi:MAG: DEAD/DEAH box helicase family protein [Candidatus Omnitrophica bacterium]|nr:DEAD/DEAH box helicase family protein [Candidatus Omnitrophota bacterium]MCM8827832.1 DEAD/DEAH box helicase family protein [Candidatus Omnitrophota bacterium]
MRLYLQNIIDDIPFENLSAKWQGFDLMRFSKDKTLFDFQQDALKNALKGLWLYFIDKQANKLNFYHHYRQNGLEDIYDYNLKRERKTAKYLLEYPEDYPVVDNKISFAHFINRMSFWMATGSGKTLIIVKLIELLGKLIAEKELPARDILFLAHRDDLLDQFKNHVEEFNSFNFDTKINLKSLRDYESVKRENALPFAKNEITVFYYRSDLISDEHKEKIVNFQNYDNGGQWYILLDEAHKGDKEDSKRQILYSILSRNGFLFNFSATFTDPRDFATCAFNFNLSKFVEEGYGKHIYVSGQDVTAFRRETDFSKQEKQKIVLKVLLLQAYINKNSEKIRKIDAKLYHRPLLLALVNSVNKPDADLQLFFKEIESIAAQEPAERILTSAKDELIAELSVNPAFYFEENENVILNIGELKKIGYKEILKYVFNARMPGAIEISFRPSDKSQVAFKLTTSDRYFALIKTGEMPQWLKSELNRFNINHRFENEVFFETLNHDDSDINILMGSRSFYEGWDSNRPNIVLFINIGVGSDAKKFVLQSVGRGVRIEPIKNKRKRLQNLFNANEVEGNLFEKIKDSILPIESLFILGTNAANLREIIATLKSEKQDKNLGELFIINPEAQRHQLLVPVYKTADRIFAEESEPQKYPVSGDDFNITSKFYNFLGDKIALAKYDCEVKVLKKAKESFAEKERYYDFGERNSLFEPELILERIFDYLGVKSKEFDKFKELENEIVHFKHIRYKGKNLDQISTKIQQVKRYPKKEERLQQLKLEFQNHNNLDRYTTEVQNLEREYVRETFYKYNTRRIKIKYLANHYYLPVLVSKTEKIDYINHIINVDSEVRFIEQLEKYIAKPDNVFAQFDWWMFSKLDATLDEVFIPYYNPQNNNIANFKPDFIFWAQKGKRYLILFVDPKGTEHADGYRKIDGYSRIFEKGEQKQSRDFSYNGLIINTKLLLKPKQGMAGVLENYKRYWFDNFVDFADKISQFRK